MQQNTYDGVVRISTCYTKIFCRLQLLRRDIERASGGLITNEECAEFIPLLDDMEKEVSARFAACRSEKDQYRSERVAVDGNGHSKFSISKEQLEYLVKYGFTAPMMSNVLGISESTVRRRLREFGLSLRKTTHITDMELDQSITEVIGTNRHIGPNSVRVRLAQKKIFVSRERVRTACARVDPDGCSLRSLERKNIKRRTYKVAGPNSLWHLDGNHKLIRWEIVIHGGIDGYSRMVTFLKASNNNRSITVFNEFIKATTKYGIPSRVRVDKGIENNDVCKFMEDLRGNGRGSAIRGKSSHNQRIERLWVDVWENVSNEYYDLFTYMEHNNILDITEEVHMLCFLFVFIPRLNESLVMFNYQYNNHPLSTESHKTPSQLFITGVLTKFNSGNKPIKEVVENAGNHDEFQNSLPPEDYGVGDSDDGDVAINSEDEDIQTIPQRTHENHLLSRLDAAINPLENVSNVEYGLKLFRKALSIVTTEEN
ncbi:uncharacterized protein LOC127707579 [Mytilus californianus]|uniref:uncharacterized protein LOC127707579 n=1 Tax=Mytilus californianus TaxID=6549 RepID=UPI002245A42C|nr:uncharacterized protein LOC127707579 [Mytilus californianus]